MIPDYIIERAKSKEPFFIDSCIDHLHLYSLQDFERDINFRPALNQKRVQFLDMEGRYEWDNEAWVFDQNTWPAHIILELIDKYSIVMNECSRINESVNSVCWKLEEKLGIPTDAHIFFSKNKTIPSFPPHWDHSHNFIIQLHGMSMITVWKDEHGEERYGNPKEVIFEHRMRPGDLVFIPAHMFHEYTPLSKRLSISFPMNENETLPPQKRTWINPFTL